MDVFETEYLIPQQISKGCWKRGKPLLIALLLVALLSSCVAIGTITITGCSKGRCKKNTQQHRAGDGLPNSFSVTIQVINNNTKGRTDESREIEISWNKAKDDLRYRESNYFHPSHRNASSVSPEGILLTSTLTVTGNITTFEIENVDFNDTACEVHKSTEWHAIVKTMLRDESDIIPSSECPGNMRRARRNPLIRFCVHNSRLLFIRYKQFKAVVLKWTTPANDNAILLLSTGAKCKIDFISHAKSLKARSLTRKTGKTCLFVHGTGKDTPKHGYETLSKFEYWGQIQQYTPQCSSHKFIKFDTVDYGWDDPILHDMFCEFAGSKESNGKLLSEKILFSHSFGNLVVAAALKRGVCKIDKATTSWFSVQAPWRGSKAADFVEGVCKCIFGKKCHFPFKRELMEFVTKEFDYCNGPAISRSYKTLQTNYKSSEGLTFQDLIETAKTHISGALCGVSAWGMGKHKSTSSLLEIVQYVSGLKHPNDGMVSLESCRITGNFKNTYESRFYEAHANHAEGSCKFGERERPNERPCSWYGKMAQNAISNF